MGALGTWTQQALEGTLLPMLAAWQQEVARHPHAAGRRAVQIEQDGVVLQDWLDHLRVSDEAGALPTWLDLAPGKLAKGKPTKKESAKPRLDKLRLAWVRSVVAACEGQAVQGVLVGSDATVWCSPMDPTVAHDDLRTLLKVWCAGLDAPLPLPMRTAVAKVADEDPESVYEGGFMRDAEADDPCWSRLYPSFEALTADGRFESLADDVWGRIQAWAMNHVTVAMHEAEGGSGNDGVTMQVVTGAEA